VSQAEPTTVGNYFISNYPPFSSWKEELAPEIQGVLARPPGSGPLGLYVHLPFCRKRCDFCYFKVYTDKNSAQIRRYLDGLLAELEIYARSPYLEGRTLDFVYFGGGTPSYLASDQLRTLFEGLRARLPWDDVREMAFECEPGTLQEGKVQLLRDLGVTRLSLGVENFDARILELGNRAHRAVEIDRAWKFIRAAGFPQVNLDLIAGMVGETDENWRANIERTLELNPESVTIYQMEVPYNTTIYQRMQDGSQTQTQAPVADWPTKRRWVAEAYARLESAGYRIGSAYTAYREGATFIYRDSLWRGADMIGLGVSSFGHLGGVHTQNEHQFDPYLQRIEAGELPVYRALPVTDEERLIREFVLQMKLGYLDAGYFQNKFGVNVLERFAAPLAAQQAAGHLTIEAGGVRLSRAGLLLIDTLLPDYFLERHRGTRYA
jgi:coproporphyrinogen III oxidase-like Fe-S oxidoreductase